MVWRVRGNGCGCTWLGLLALLVGVLILRFAAIGVASLVSTPMGATLFILFLLVAGYGTWQKYNQIKAKIQAASAQYRSESWGGSMGGFGNTYGEWRRTALPTPDPGPSAYEILGVPPQATQQEIATAYREKAKQYHPDKVAHLAPEFREMAETRMKEINVAYQQLRES